MSHSSKSVAPSDSGIEPKTLKIGVRNYRVQRNQMNKTTQILKKGKIPQTKIPSGVKHSFHFTKITAQEISRTLLRCYQQPA